MANSESQFQLKNSIFLDLWNKIDLSVISKMGVKRWILLPNIIIFYRIVYQSENSDSLLISESQNYPVHYPIHNSDPPPWKTSQIYLSK